MQFLNHFWISAFEWRVRTLVTFTVTFTHFVSNCNIHGFFTKSLLNLQDVSDCMTSFLIKFYAITMLNDLVHCGTKTKVWWERGIHFTNKCYLAATGLSSSSNYIPWCTVGLENLHPTGCISHVRPFDQVHMTIHNSIFKNSWKEIANSIANIINASRYYKPHQNEKQFKLIHQNVWQKK